jgi:CheY-like chemotaxis protein
MSEAPYILYIEDERASIELVRTILDLAGYVMKGVTSGEEGLALMQADKPALVLLDLVMPNTISGVDVYREMKNNPALADIPVIILTGKVPKTDRVIVSGLPPVDDYITKPFKPDRLVRAIKDSLKIDLCV